jgi:hypothetical protein
MLCLLGFALWLVSVAQDICIYGFSCRELTQIIGYLDVEAERSLYTWYSTCILLLTGFIASCHADRVGRHGPHFRQWVGIGVLFVYLSLDEMLSVHEKLSAIGGRIVEPTGFFRYSWVVPGLFLAGIVAFSLSSLVLDLPKRQRFWTIASGAIFLGGAVGMEMISGKIAFVLSRDTLLYQAVNSVEEAMEVIAVLMFMWVVASLDRQTLPAVAGEALVGRSMPRPPASKGTNPADKSRAA